MNEFRKNFGKKIVSEKTLLAENTNNHKIIAQETYKTNGESFILTKDIEETKIILDPETTIHITIKSLTITKIVSLRNKIDETYDEVLLNKGSCCEFYLFNDVFYILSSDGMKID